MAILDAIFNISKRSMMPEWHQFELSSAMHVQQESLCFSTGLNALFS